MATLETGHGLHRGPHPFEDQGRAAGRVARAPTADRPGQHAARRAGQPPAGGPRLLGPRRRHPPARPHRQGLGHPAVSAGPGPGLGRPARRRGPPGVGRPADLGRARSRGPGRPHHRSRRGRRRGGAAPGRAEGARPGLGGGGPAGHPGPGLLGGHRRPGGVRQPARPAAGRAGPPGRHPRGRERHLLPGRQCRQAGPGPRPVRARRPGGGRRPGPLGRRGGRVVHAGDDAATGAWATPTWPPSTRP